MNQYFKFKQFEQLKNIKMFNTVKVDGLSIEWQNRADICSGKYIIIVKFKKGILKNSLLYIICFLIESTTNPQIINSMLKIKLNLNNDKPM